MNIHIALYKWKPEVDAESIATAFTAVEALADKVPGIVEISTAKNTSRYSEGFTHVILVRGETQESIDAYRAHPDHVKVARAIDAMEASGWR